MASTTDRDTPMVSVVIPCFNQARFLADAIESVLGQTYRDFETVVIDDGSTDETPLVAGRYPEVRYVKQANQGLAAARNAGIRASRGHYLVFLDADDRLLPRALSAGLQCMEENKDCAFVSGGHRYIDEAGVVMSHATPPRIEKDHYLAFLHENYVGMHGAVMYRHSVLTACDGFKESLPACEDYELYLRLSRTHPVSCHDEVVAEYRIYDSSLSADAVVMLRSVLQVLRSQRQYLMHDPHHRRAYREGFDLWKRYYAEKFITQLPATWARREFMKILAGVMAMSRYAPGPFYRWVYLRALRPHMPRHLLRLIARLRGYPYSPPVGRICFGDFGRLTPISKWYGFDRGLPIDRYYIERFLADHSQDIRGRVLEIGDPTYTFRYGGERVSKSDVLDVSEGNPFATLVGDLTCAEHIPSNTYDAVIVCQTLHLIYDLQAAIATIQRILKPEGVLLLTVPGVSQISRDQWKKSWFWSFTSLTIHRLLEEVFPPESVTVEAHGNVLAATAFLNGIAAAEIGTNHLDFRDTHYELVVTGRASKPATGNE